MKPSQEKFKLHVKNKKEQKDLLKYAIFSLWEC